MIHRTCQIGICESDSPKGRGPQYVTRRRFAIFPKEKSRLRIEIRVAPSIQDNSRNVALCIKPRAAEHFCELLPDAPLIFAERRSQHLAAPAMSLIFCREAGIRIKNLERQNDRCIWIYRRFNAAAHCQSTYVKIISNPI